MDGDLVDAACAGSVEISGGGSAWGVEGGSVEVVAGSVTVSLIVEDVIVSGRGVSVISILRFGCLRLPKELAQESKNEILQD